MPNKHCFDDEVLTHPTGSILRELARGLRVFVESLRGYFIFRDLKNCITVYGSARYTHDHPYYKMAQALGKTLAANKLALMSGGGPGLMEAVSQGAFEAGGMTAGCKIYLPEEQAPNCYLKKYMEFHYFFTRKVCLTRFSSGFIMLPGGIGTLDEMFELTTLLQTHRIENYPIVLMGKEFWEDLMVFLKHTMLKEQTISPSDINRLFITDSPEEAVVYLCKKIRAMTS